MKHRGTRAGLNDRFGLCCKTAIPTYSSARSPMLLLIVPVGLAASDWEELSTKLEQSVWSSSPFCEEIRGKEVCYIPEQLFDGEPGFCWVEAAPGGGIGEWVLFAVNWPVQELRLVNGFARSPALFQNNNCIKRLRLSFVVGFTAPGLVTELDYYLYFLSEMKQEEVQIEDTIELQTVDFSVSNEEQSGGRQSK